MMLVVLVMMLAQVLARQAGVPTRGEWGNQGDGTYANPVLPGDFSDLDAIRVGEHFYAITSTFQYSPGMAVLQSEDLVRWRIIGHVVEDVTRISPEMNWDRMNRAGRGIWAGSIRFHGGRFWVYFGTPDEGLFMSSAASVVGPWSAPVLVLAGDRWDDPCPFWDDDGQLYLVATDFRADASGVSYHIHLFKLTADGKGIVAGSDRVIHHSRGSEANKLYKIHGLYFHYYSEVAGEGRVIMMERAKSLEGPWETKQLIHVHGAVDKEPNQGGLMELGDGRWYFLSHQGKGDWEGRAGVLLPVTWVDGWPVIGAVGADGIGSMVWRGAVPFAGRRAGAASGLPAVSDGFDAAALDPAWEWNYQPRAGKWSLAERRGFLRLKAFAPLRAGDPLSVGNVLTQRSMRTAFNQVTAKLDVSGMATGQSAGLVHYARTVSRLAVVQEGAVRRLTLLAGDEVQGGPVLTSGVLWLRSTWGFDGVSQWSYSVDGRRFLDFGASYQLTWGHYRGDRIGIFTVNLEAEAGVVDVDSFSYQVSGPGHGESAEPSRAVRVLPLNAVFADR